nr:ABC transporter permease [Muribaculaceae bacterium]
MNSNIWLVIRREFLERVTKKSFIITTLLMPIIMLALMVAPAAIMSLNTSDAKVIGVLDSRDSIGSKLQSDEYVKFVMLTQARDEAMTDETLDGILEIGPNIVDNPNNVRLYSRDAAPAEVTADITNQLNRIIETERMEAYNIDNLDKIIKEVQVDVNLSTARITSDNDTTDTSQMLSMIIGFVMTFVLYMFLLMYGQMVMTSIIEEKNNRVLEVMVSSVKPTHLMMGKIVGVGLVAVVQVVIWGALIATFSSILMPMIMPAELMADVNAYSAGTLTAAQANTDIDLVQAIATLGSLGFILKIFGYILLFLIGGFLFYAAINAAIGSSVDNIQDASQLQVFVVIPVLLGMVFALSVVNDPTSSMAMWLSFIPFTSPMVMMARIPFDIPGWEIVVSLVILYISFVLMVWIAAKIYRVGIFMYGKKPSIKELIR